MATLFRAGRRDEAEAEAGAGGKLVRGRLPRPSPYARPRRSPSRAPRQSQSPRWLSGLISGAGKLISSVFGSQSTSPSSSSGSSHSSDDETFGASSRELIEKSQILKAELFADYMEGSLAIIPRTESKLAIEQLLTQETFSRDECNRLTKIIQSRVMESPYAEVSQCREEMNLYNRTTGSGVQFSGTKHSAEENRKPPETPPYRTNTQNAISRGSSPLSMYAPDLHAKAIAEAKKWFKKTPGSGTAFSETRQSADKKRKQPETPYRSSTQNASFPGSSPLWMCAPDLHVSAVMEAKKWFKEKKLASSSKSDTDCGPCILNTDMLQYAFAGEVGSPVDMAKTYMRSLPPWRTSPLNINFRTPPSRMHLYEHEICRETINHHVPTSKVLERNGIAVGSGNLVDGNHIDHQELGDDKYDMSNFKPAYSFTGLSEPESFRISSASGTKGRAPRPDDTAVFGLDKNQVEEPASMKAQVSNSAALRGYLDHVSVSKANGEKPLLEMKATPFYDAKLTIPSRLINSGVGGSLQTKTSSQGHMISDSRPSDGDSQLQPNGSTRKISLNDSSGQLNATSDFGVDSTQSRNGEQAASISEDSCEAAMGVLAEGSKNITGRSKDGTRMRSIERMLVEPEAKTARRGRKRVAHKSKKTKGRVG